MSGRIEVSFPLFVDYFAGLFYFFLVRGLLAMFYDGILGRFGSLALSLRRKKIVISCDSILERYLLTSDFC